MAFEQDVLIGVRRGAALLALMLAGLAIYRIGHPHTVPAEPASGESAAPVQAAPLDVMVGPPVVPPPPPLEKPASVARKVVARRVPQAAATPVPQTLAETSTDPAPVVEEKSAAVEVESPKQEIAAEHTDETEPAAVSPPASPAVPQKGEPQKLRWLKAVGRFLRGGAGTPADFKK
jgi:hypothetical protein